MLPLDYARCSLRNCPVSAACDRHQTAFTSDYTVWFAPIDLNALGCSAYIAKPLPIDPAAFMAQQLS